VNRVNFTDSFSYDDNGNMTCRTEAGVTYVQTYNAENRIASIQKLASGTCASPGNLTAKWDFTGACPERKVECWSRPVVEGMETACGQGNPIPPTPTGSREHQSSLVTSSAVG
jgi:hypothetical protein